MLSSNITQSNTGMRQSATTSVASNSSSSINSTVGLVKGQTIHGEVVDLRSNEVSVKLDDGRLMNGKIENTVNLAIGDKVTFRVEDVSYKNLTLKIIPDNMYHDSDNTIDKALEAAGLTKNGYNRSIVSELLNQQMSIDKKTISQILQESILHKDCSVETLVLMNKYKIPITNTLITQFEAYQNGEHSIMKELNTLTSSISNLFSEIGNSSDMEAFRQGEDILNLILNARTGKFEEATNTAVNSQVNIFKQAMDKLQNTSPATGNLLNQENSQTLSELLKSFSSQYNISDSLLDSIKNGTADLRQTASLINQILEKESFQSELPRVTTESDELAAALKPSADGSITNNGNPPNVTLLKESSAAQTILTAYEDLQYNQNELGSFLGTAGRMKLMESLDSFPFSPEIKNLISSGDIVGSELLQLIQNNLGDVPEDIIGNLYSSKEFQTLLKEELTTKWTFTPKSLLKEKEIENHFMNLSKELSELKEFMEKSSGRLSGQIAGKADNLQENIGFMKTLNDLFTYVQLPMKLKNQNAHGELYVYSRKKEGRTAKDGISVLLHLDMEHLGPIDIHLDLHNNNVVGKFYLSSDDTKNIISSHLSELQEALYKKGFTLNTELLERNKEINIVNDFMKQDSAVLPVTRYNFDIRA